MLQLERIALDRYEKKRNPLSIRQNQGFSLHELLTRSKAVHH